MSRAALLMIVALFLAACDTSSSPSPVAPPSAASSPGGEIIGPVILDPDHTSTTVPVGRMVVFNVDNPESWAITADPDGIVKVQQGTNDGSAVFNPGAEALTPGTTTVTLTNPGGEKLVFTVTVE